MKQLSIDFVNETLQKIKSVIDEILKYYNVKMEYELDKRAQIFCELIKMNDIDAFSNDTFDKIQDALAINETLTDPQQEWLSDQIYQFNKDIFLLHYFYALLYTYNYDVKIQEKLTEDHIKEFFNKSNLIHKKYKNLTLNK